MESKRAKELAEAHWNGYVGPLTANHATASAYTQDEVYRLCEFHYRTALAHGHRHGVEDERNGLFRPRIGEVAQYAPAHPYLHKDELSPSEAKSLADSISPPSLCGTCIRQGCPVDCAEHTTECGEYLPQGGEGVEDIPCHSCRDVGPCMSSQKWEEGGCDGYSPEQPLKDTRDTLSLSLPSITVEGDLEQVHEKYEEERQEWGMCNAGTIEGDIEAWDVVQARQTYAERGGNVDVLTGGRPEYVLRVIAERYADAPEQVLAAKRAMIVKNAARAMYAPEVCLKIVMSGGKEW